MDKIKLFSVTAALVLLTSCGGGGGGENSPSRFDGIWTGELHGADCSGAPVSKAFRHRVDAESDDSEAKVRLVDEDGNVYEGTVIVTASIAGAFWGFSSQSVDKPGSFITYDIAETPDGSAQVTEVITVPPVDDIANADCSYDLSGIATNESTAP